MDSVHCMSSNAYRTLYVVQWIAYIVCHAMDSVHCMSYNG